MTYVFRLAMYIAVLVAISPVAFAQVPPAPAPSPAASATPSDPCGGDARLLATINRPTIGYSPCAVAAGTIVLEEGYQNQQQGTNFLTTLVQYPQSFTRIGLKPRFEMDIIGPYFNTTAMPNREGNLVRTAGYQDSGLGFKYEFVPAGPFTIGIDGLYTSPNGSPLYTNGGAAETLNLDVAYAVTQTFSIGTTQSIASTSGLKANGTVAKYGTWMPSVVATQQFSNSYQLFAEYVYLSKLAPNQNGRSSFDYGLQHLLGKRFEIDIELGNSITADRNLQFHYVGAGFGVQLR